MGIFHVLVQFTNHLGKRVELYYYVVPGFHERGFVPPWVGRGLCGCASLGRSDFVSLFPPVLGEGLTCVSSNGWRGF